MPILDAARIKASLIDVQTIIAGELPPVDWLVDGLIAKEDRVLVYGEPGSLKSWLMLDLGLHIAAGKQWLGHFEVPEAKRVLYIDEEMSSRTLHRRIKRLIDGSHLGDDPMPFRALSLCGVRFDNDQVADGLLIDLDALGFSPEVTIIETVRRVIDGSENNADEVAALWRRLGPFRQDGKTLLITHHMRKPTIRGFNEAIYRASGSTDILGGSDSAFAIEKRQTNKVAVTCVRVRNNEEPEPFSVTLDDAGNESPVSMLYEAQAAAAAIPIRAAEMVVAWIEEYLRDQPHGRGRTADIKRHLQEVHQVSPSRSEKALALMRRTARGQQERRGLYQLAAQEEEVTV